jgi:hypothetical protein
MPRVSTLLVFLGALFHVRKHTEDRNNSKNTKQRTNVAPHVAAQYIPMVYSYALVPILALMKASKAAEIGDEMRRMRLGGPPEPTPLVSTVVSLKSTATLVRTKVCQCAGETHTHTYIYITVLVHVPVHLYIYT